MAVRNIRRDALHQVKELLKSKDITEDEERKAEDDIQKLTDKFVKDVDGVVLTQDTTRVAMPGLALPRAVAEAHGGSVSLGAARPRGLRLDVRLGAR